MRQRGVFEKIPGSGVYWIRYADATGRIHREKAGNKSAAVILYQKRKTEVLQGKKLPERLRGRAVGFAELAQDALAYSKGHKRSYGDDVFRMARLLGWFRDRTADGVTPQEIERRVDEATEQDDWKPATVNRYRALLSPTYRLGIRNGKVTSNPARLVRHRIENNTRVRWLTTDEEKKLREVMKACYPEHLQELQIALNTGLRLSEQYGLLWENVDFLRQMLTIPRSKHGEVRYVPINSAALAAFRELRLRGNGSGPVFLNTRGEPLTGPRYWFEAAVQDAKMEHFTWHFLRHTFASRLVMAGVDLRTVQELMGHKSIITTMRYAHLAPAHQLAAVERLAQMPAHAHTEQPTDTKTSTGAIEAGVPGATHGPQPISL